MNTYFNEAIYNTFRKNTQNYKKRLLMSEGDSVIKRLKKLKNFFPFLAHDFMANYFN